MFFQVNGNNASPEQLTFLVDLSQTPTNIEISPTKGNNALKAKAVDQFGNNTSILVNTPLMIYSVGFFSLVHMCPAVPILVLQ